MSNARKSDVEKLRLSEGYRIFLYSYLLGNNNVKLNKKQKEDADATYFAICILMPRKSFLQVVNILGGINNVIHNKKYIYIIQRVFKVPMDAVVFRVMEFYLEDLEDKKDNNNFNKLSAVINDLVSEGHSEEEITDFVRKICKEK